MTGIDRLRALAGAWDEWGLGGALAEIADEIERELVRQGEPDSTDNDARLLYVTDEDREALEWVRKYGGIGCVQTMAAKLGDTLNWIRERAGISKYEVVDYDELLDAIDRRLMPEGYEWPRYESGDLVMFGDCVENRNGTCTVNSVRFYSGGGVTVYGEDRGARFVVVTEPVMHEPIRKANPKVIAADGEPLEVGQTVYDVDDGTEYKVGGIRDTADVDGDLCKIIECSNDELHIYYACIPPDKLTHAKPEPPDSWDALWDDVEDCDVGYESFMRRCRALAERERGQ